MKAFMIAFCYMVVSGIIYGVTMNVSSSACGHPHKNLPPIYEALLWPVALSAGLIIKESAYIPKDC